jgi:AcrR family transcriptional regulator
VWLAVYRHFPQRAALIAAVYRREIGACAAAAQVLAREHEAFEALTRTLRASTFGEPADSLHRFPPHRLIHFEEALLEVQAFQRGALAGSDRPDGFALCGNSWWVCALVRNPTPWRRS